MNFWGYNISETRSINYDTNDKSMTEYIASAVPSSKLCIGCGGCTAGNLTDFNIRKVQMLMKRGETKDAKEQLQKCMLCGKCMLVCPRGVETRKMILEMLNYIREQNKIENRE